VRTDALSSMVGFQRRAPDTDAVPKVDLEHRLHRPEHFCCESDKWSRSPAKRWRHRRLLAPSSLC
jgi:hypothetical protein